VFCEPEEPSPVKLIAIFKQSTTTTLLFSILTIHKTSRDTRGPPYPSIKMAKNKRSRAEAETYDSDGGFISNDDGKAPKSKKSKKAGASKGSSGSVDQFWAVTLS
jgi:hypothetical protein